nr:helix-turn-helix domain-containing protein [Haloferax sp. Atlit-4N]
MASREPSERHVAPEPTRPNRGDSPITMSYARVVFVLVALVLTGAVLPAPVMAMDEETTNETAIEGAFTNTVPVDQPRESTFLWASERNTLSVEFDAPNESNIYEVCVRNESGYRVDCTDKGVSSGTQTVEFSYESLSEFEGSSNVSVVLWNSFPGQSEQIASDTVNITILRKDGDIDGDKLSNANELSNNTSMFLMDTDKDSLQDGAEVKNYGTSPTTPDTDGDGLNDAAELSNSLEPTDPDTDGDGIPDGVEMRLGTPPNDSTADTDGDGLDDGYEYEHGTDPVDPDTDGDGLNDGLERKLGTDPTDGSTTPMLVFTGGTLLGVVAVGGRWFLASSEYQLEAPVSAPQLFEPVGTETDDGDDESDSPSTPPEFDRDELQQSSQPVLTDEDKVIQLLRDNGGWVYQSRIVEQTGWSKSKVSRLLSSMDELGTVEKISVGRQNIVAEEGSMPEGAGSPFDE